MKLKGSATIELTNADGSKEFIKHDNMITNAVNDLFTTQGGDIAPIFKIANNNDSYAETLFGGILLFNEVLNEDASDYTIPTTKVTGYASQDAYAGIDTARGSFNKTEGGVQEDGSYKFVWDFATSQANGNIKSIALCPNVMGKIGMTLTPERSGAYSLTRDSQAPFNKNDYLIPSGGETDGLSNYYYNIVAIIGDIAYAVDSYNVYQQDGNSNRGVLQNGGILKLYKFKLNISSVSLADRVCVARYLGCTDVQLPSDFVDFLKTLVSSTSMWQSPISYFFNQRDGKLIVFPCGFVKKGIDPKGTIKYIDIDLNNNFNISSYTFTNNSKGTILDSNAYTKPCVFDYDACYAFFVCNDYVIFITTDKKAYVASRSDNTDIKQLKKNGEEFIFTELNYLRPIFACENILVFASNKTEGSYGYSYVLDLKTGEVIETSASAIYSHAQVSYGNKAVSVRTNPYLAYKLMINPFIMTTKNNLDTPIVKTASQTMKITYTLSEVADESANGGAGDSGTSSGTTSGGTSTSDTSETDNKTVTENNNNGGA